MNENEEEPKKKFMDKGMDFWFHDQKTIKVLRFGIILTTVALWILIPLVIIKMFWNMYVYRSFWSFLLAVFLTYAFFGVTRGLSNVNKLLKDTR